MSLKSSFAPVADDRTRILILGSLPGDRSLQASQYYAHPQNRFWKLMFLLLGETPFDHYDERLTLLLKCGIGLWDVTQKAHRVGSMDSDIHSVVPNPIPEFLERHPGIDTIAFNGAKAAAIYHKHFEKKTGIDLLELPSTSPANARYNIDRLLDAWSVILQKRS